MAFLFRSHRFTDSERPASLPGQNGWYESSFDLKHGLVMTEDVSFEEYERLCALDPTPKAAATSPLDLLLRPQ
jgi:hypothetical protein